MWIGSLALIGVPPLSGFWSKDSVLVACWESGQYALFAVALLTVILTSFYVIRLMGMIFNGGTSVEPRSEVEDHEARPHHEHGEASWVMLVPYGVLAVLTVLIGLAGPFVGDFLTSAFHEYYTGALNIAIANGSAVSSAETLSGLGLEIIVAVASTLMIVIGALPAYRLYISHKLQPETTVGKSRGLRSLYKFMWNRWYIDTFYTKVFVNTTIALQEPLKRYIESALDRALNRGIPQVFQVLSKQFKKIQTGILSVNMLYFLLFLVLIILLLRLGGFL
jgi:NADH-quinone oxidoreductase subunit L